MMDDPVIKRAQQQLINHFAMQASFGVFEPDRETKQCQAYFDGYTTMVSPLPDEWEAAIGFAPAGDERMALFSLITQLVSCTKIEMIDNQTGKSCLFPPLPLAKTFPPPS